MALAKFDERLWLDGFRRMLILGRDRVERMAVVVLLRAVLEWLIERHHPRLGVASRCDAARKAVSNNARVRLAACCHEKSCARPSAAAAFASRSAALSMSSARIAASACASAGGKNSPASAAISRLLGVSATATGNPLPMASTKGKPNDSTSDGNADMSRE